MTNPETEAQSAADDSNLPERYRAARFTTFEEVMPKKWLAEVGEWLHSQRNNFRRGGDEDGRERFSYELAAMDEIYKQTATLKAEVAARLDDAVKLVGVPDFDLEFIECHATLYHHGNHYAWHNDTEGARRLAYCLYMHTDPRMFSGGELEFADGTMVDANHGRLAIYDPNQQHRIRRVECWSAAFLHGRWALSGWIHGAPQP